MFNWDVQSRGVEQFRWNDFQLKYSTNVQSSIEMFNWDVQMLRWDEQLSRWSDVQLRCSINVQRSIEMFNQDERSSWGGMMFNQLSTFNWDVQLRWDEQLSRWSDVQSRCSINVQCLIEMFNQDERSSWGGMMFNQLSTFN